MRLLALFSIEEVDVFQHGQVFKLKTRGVDGQPLWAYRYRLEGRGSERRQVGGFATRAEAEKSLRKVLDRLGPGGGRAMVIFAAATGLRPSELFGLEQRDVDGEAGVVYVRRAYANGRLKHTKTRMSMSAVPLQAKALSALDRLPASENPILFPNMRGGRIDFRVFGRKHWKPAQIAAGIEPLRGLYDLRHPTRPSRSARASRCSQSPASWSRASR